MSNAEALVGCLMSVLRLCVQLPLLMVILYFALQNGPTPEWVWYIFWGYIPVAFILGVFGSMVEAAVKVK